MKLFPPIYVLVPEVLQIFCLYRRCIVFLLHRTGSLKAHEIFGQNKKQDNILAANEDSDKDQILSAKFYY
jgi:hypothetical protein